MIKIVEKIYESKKQKQRVYPCRSNRASQLGHPCERYLVYMRTDWDKQQPPEVTREFLFEGGRFIEELGIRQLTDAGFRITNQGRDFELKEQEITGHVDCFVQDTENRHKQYPCEIKGISPYDWEAINTADDMLKSEKAYMRAYPAQLQLYLLMSNCEEGLFYIINKLTYVPKEIWVKLDYNYAEGLLQKAEKIIAHIKNKTLPDRINDYKTCKNCPFNHICRPDLDFGEGIAFLNDLELEQALNRKAELEQNAKEYNKLDKEIKKHLQAIMKDKTDITVGNWIITKKHIKGIRKPSPGGEYEYDKFDISRLNDACKNY